MLSGILDLLTLFFFLAASFGTCMLESYMAFYISALSRTQSSSATFVAGPLAFLALAF